MTGALTFGAIPPEGVDLVWDVVAPMLIPALDTAAGKFEISDVYAQLRTGELLLWVVADDMTPIAALTTQLIVYPGRRAMAIDWLGGSRMKEWLPMAQAMIMRYARDNECLHLEAYGRRAWQRWLGKFGWAPEYISYRMELTDG